MAASLFLVLFSSSYSASHGIVSLSPAWTLSASVRSVNLKGKGPGDCCLYVLLALFKSISLYHTPQLHVEVRACFIYLVSISGTFRSKWQYTSLFPGGGGGGEVGVGGGGGGGEQS